VKYFIVTLDYFCGRPVGTLVMRGNSRHHDHWERRSAACGKIPTSSPQKCPFRGHLDLHVIGLRSFWTHPSPHPKRHIDRFSRFCRTHVCYRQTDRQTDRQTTLLRLSTVKHQLHVMTGQCRIWRDSNTRRTRINNCQWQTRAASLRHGKRQNLKTVTWP